MEIMPNFSTSITTNLGNIFNRMAQDEILPAVSTTPCQHECQTTVTQRSDSTTNHASEPNAARVATGSATGSRSDRHSRSKSCNIPRQFRARQYDAMLIYTPTNEPVMQKFKFIIENLIVLENGSRPAVCMCNCDDSPNFQAIMDALVRTTHVFIYSSNNSFGSRCSRHKKDEIIAKCLERPDRRLIPVLPSKEHEAPIGLRALRALNLQKLLSGKNIQDMTTKDLEVAAAQGELQDSSEFQALVRLLNNGLAAKQKRSMKQKQLMDAWMREQQRKSQLQQAMHVAAAAADQGGASQNNAQSDTSSNESCEIQQNSQNEAIENSRKAAAIRGQSKQRPISDGGRTFHVHKSQSDPTLATNVTIATSDSSVATCSHCCARNCKSLTDSSSPTLISRVVNPRGCQGVRGTASGGACANVCINIRVSGGDHQYSKLADSSHSTESEE